jgi:hypothetical protein
MGYRIQRLRKGLVWERWGPANPYAERHTRYCTPWKPLVSRPTGRYRTVRHTHAVARFVEVAGFTPEDGSVCDWGVGLGRARRIEEAQP